MNNRILKTLEKALIQQVTADVCAICDNINIDPISVKFNLDFSDITNFEEGDICFHSNNMKKIDKQKNSKVFICSKDDHVGNHFSYCIDWMRFFLLDGFTPRVFLFRQDQTKFVDIFFQNNKNECIHDQISWNDLGEKISPPDLIFNYFIFEKSLDNLIDPNLLTYLQHYGKMFKTGTRPNERQFKHWLQLSYKHHLITRRCKQEFLSTLELLCLIFASEGIIE